MSIKIKSEETKKALVQSLVQRKDTLLDSVRPIYNEVREIEGLIAEINGQVVMVKESPGRKRKKSKSKRHRFADGSDWKSNLYAALKYFKKHGESKVSPGTILAHIRRETGTKVKKDLALTSIHSLLSKLTRSENTDVGREKVSKKYVYFLK